MRLRVIRGCSGRRGWMVVIFDRMPLYGFGFRDVINSIKSRSHRACDPATTSPRLKIVTIAKGCRSHGKVLQRLQQGRSKASYQSPT